jgi:hypothetical protein
MDEFDSPEFMECMRLYLMAREGQSASAVMAEAQLSAAPTASLNDSLDEAVNPQLYVRLPRPNRNWPIDSLDEALNPHLYDSPPRPQLNDQPPRPHRNWSFDSLDEAINPHLYFQPYQHGGVLADHIEVSRTFDQHIRKFNVQGQAFRVLICRNIIIICCNIIIIYFN